MKKNSYMLAVYALVASSHISFASQNQASYWQNFSALPQSIYNGITFVWTLPAVIQAYFTHAGALIGHNCVSLNGHGFEEFRYDTSRDSSVMKDMRKKLHLSGLYFADGADMDVYQKYISSLNPIEQSYIDNGFDINNDNTVSAAMFRLLAYMVRIKLNQSDSISKRLGCMKLLSELDNILPASFDGDDSSELIGNFAELIMSHAQNAQSPAYLKELLAEWQKNSYRFNKNQGLLTVINAVNDLI
jgi:hypothetical protein